MPTKLIRRSPAIAQTLVEARGDHLAALEKAPLPYLDCLIDATLAAEPMHPWQLQQRLYDMTPRLLAGTARRMIDLKFHNAGRTELLFSTAH